MTSQLQHQHILYLSLVFANRLYAYANVAATSLTRTIDVSNRIPFDIECAVCYVSIVIRLTTDIRIVKRRSSIINTVRTRFVDLRSLRVPRQQSTRSYPDLRRMLRLRTPHQCSSPSAGHQWLRHRLRSSLPPGTSPFQSPRSYTSRKRRSGCLTGDPVMLRQSSRRSTERATYHRHYLATTKMYLVNVCKRFGNISFRRSTSGHC